MDANAARAGPPPAPRGLRTVPWRAPGAAAMLRAAATAWTRRRPGRSATPHRETASDLVAFGVQALAVNVQAAHVDAYARVCGFAAARTAPPVYGHVLGFPLQMALLLDERFPWPLPGLVHLESRLLQHEPLHGGMKVDLAVWVERFAPHPRGETVAIGLQISQGGHRLWEGENLYLHRAATARAPGAATPPSAPAPCEPPTRCDAWCVPADTGRRYARVAGDFNPIHLHAAAARLFGFRHAIAHGMWTFARALASLGTLPPQGRAWARFLAPLSLPAQVHCAIFEPGPTHAPTRRCTEWAVRSPTGRLHAQGAWGPLPGAAGREA